MYVYLKTYKHTFKTIKGLSPNTNQDTQWTDIDTMNLQMDWSFDNVTFRELPMIVKDLHDHDQHYINIIDVIINYEINYNNTKNKFSLKFYKARYQ